MRYREPEPGRGWSWASIAKRGTRILIVIYSTAFGFRQNLFEIKDVLGESIEAEMWDKGWTKIYEVYPEGKFTLEYQSDVGGRMAEIITCLHPIYADLRNDVARAFR